MVATDALIIPCSSDGSSARAIDNVGSLLYGIMIGKDYGAANFAARTKSFGMKLPSVHSVVLNRSTQYSQKASKAFGAMFDEIKRHTNNLRDRSPQYFGADGPMFSDIPDSHSVAIVCSHLGRPLYSVKPGRYQVHDTEPQVNSEPLDRYKEDSRVYSGNLSRLRSLPVPAEIDARPVRRRPPDEPVNLEAVGLFAVILAPCRFSY
jgi:chromosome partitioning protein